MAQIPPGSKDLMVNGKVVGQYISTGDTELDLPIARARLQELGYEQRELPLWMHIRQQAIYFQDTCTLLWNTELARPPPRRPFALIPYAVNTAFCVELYLKALALKHGRKLRGHELLELYNELPPEALADIEASIPDALRDVPLSGEPVVPEFISMMNNVFVHWRYAYEHQELAQLRMDVLSFMRMLMFYACRNIVPKPA
ncbi:hypothetical protein [Rhodanobacter sp. C03]|uniref:hypothetical protein n=1 Tax=Rhodanobacter sp. C03 TaxID=1945858 RepID=UPI00098634A2|nr:hypothetical protein [Rhodanobacter sp. C03]OOG59854.1 hypothetical protein B0E48_03445 [Rhodanobacter sp. C03]